MGVTPTKWVGPQRNLKGGFDKVHVINPYTLWDLSGFRTKSEGLGHDLLLDHYWWREKNLTGLFCEDIDDFICHRV